MIQKAYKFRIYPSDEQKVLLEKHFGSVRWVYNWGLAKKIKEYETNKKNIGCFELINMLPYLKKQKETEWLKEIHSQPLQMALRNLDNAFTSFFKKRHKFPNFKTKHKSRKSFHYPAGITRINFKDKKIVLPKIGEMDYSDPRQFEGKIKICTVSKTPTNKYFISILVEENKEFPKKFEVESSTTIGIDLGLKDFLITSNGTKFANPKFLRQSEQRLKILQRRHSRKQKGSKNREESRKQLALQYERVTNQRNDFLHKLTYRLTHDNQVNTICMENLSVENMLKNHKLAKSVADASWNKFEIFLKYKSNWYGKNLIQIGRFEPSSKVCSVCGHIKKDLTLADRIWICQECHTKHDRDINAANNIKKFGLLQIDRKLGVGSLLQV